MAKGIKTGGRTAGTPNKLSSEIKGILKDLIYDEFEKLPQYLNTLETKDRVEVILKLIPYVLPKFNNVHDFGN